MFLVFLNLFLNLFLISFCIYFLLDILIIKQCYIIQKRSVHNYAPVINVFYFVKNKYTAIILSEEINNTTDSISEYFKVDNFDKFYGIE